ncbi:hypothetical protein BD289DRAFT_271220 [Coniella lustricola]|uniref:Restriction endonuclease type IV Mrr domain-containing protein n=1 Tax=Coniella lustricola TaxID=2025994 RepID=A0A2T3AKF6_9PEZI|nr:hypothetical protein BD289DRAFT_271220 [Coniella lustricola]
MRPLFCHGLNASQRLPILAKRALAGSLLSTPWTTLRRKSSVATLIYPDPPSTNHHDLPSFLEYAERSGLDRKSTLYVGTHYEYTIAQVLTKYGFYLQRIGGHSDYGTDLLGTWTVPSSKEPLRILVQCKAIARKSAPNLIRELEGAFVGAPVGWRGQGVLGLFVTEKPSTKGVRDSLGRSQLPMLFMSCTRDGRVQQLLWNQRAEEEGLEGLGVGTRYAGGDGEQQLLLKWKDRPIALKGPRKPKSSTVSGH